MNTKNKNIIPKILYFFILLFIIAYAFSAELDFQQSLVVSYIIWQIQVDIIDINEKIIENETNRKN